MKDTIRVVAVQFELRRVASVEDFYERLAFHVGVAGDYQADFVVFPELFTMQLLSAAPRKLSAAEGIDELTRHTPRLVEQLRDLALRRKVNIIGGSHLTRLANGEVRNICHVVLRDGTVHERHKIHPTSNERSGWSVTGGDHLAPVQTDCGPVGVAICYDSEFPELPRKLTDDGALILFVPFCTDSRQGYLRVRHCTAARTIENQIYAVMAGDVGVLTNVENMDINFAQSCVLAPCDIPFARDGVMADVTENLEGIAVADLDMKLIAWARSEGSVRNLADRRSDLYRVEWTRKS